MLCCVVLGCVVCLKEILKMAQPPIEESSQGDDCHEMATSKTKTVDEDYSERNP